jgi:hypothetical protein
MCARGPARPFAVLLNSNDDRKRLKAGLGIQSRPWIPFLIMDLSRPSGVGDSCERCKSWFTTTVQIQRKD